MTGCAGVWNQYTLLIVTLVIGFGVGNLTSVMSVITSVKLVIYPQDPLVRGFGGRQNGQNHIDTRVTLIMSLQGMM